MNGDTNGTMGEPMDTSVPSELNSTPALKQLTSDGFANGIKCVNSNNTDGEDSKDELAECKSSIINENNSSGDANKSEADPLGDSQDNKTTYPDDDSGNSEEIKPDKKNNVSEETTNDHGGDCLGENESQENNLKKKDGQFDRDNLCEMVNNSSNKEPSLDSSQEINTNKNMENSQEQENYKNGLESKHNSDESCGSDDDTGEDTMSSGENEKNTKHRDRINSNDAALKKETFKIINIYPHHSDEEVKSINLSDYSCSEGEIKAEDTVSIDSDSGDDQRETGVLNKSNDSIILIETDGPGGLNGTAKSNDVHEIVSDNDDCVLTVEGSPAKKTDSAKKKKSKGGSMTKADETNKELRRSSRTIKRKKYDDNIEPLDDESDVEEVLLEDPLRRKSKNLNNTFIEITSRQGKSGITHIKKDANIVFIDSPPPAKNHLPLGNKSGTSNLNQNLYQTISARGTSVTPISIKSTSTQVTQACQTPVQTPIQPPSQPILPTLTDDMFVVEAPSFIVPYVYEKPAKVPFKEFVDKWGKELEEEKAKEEQTLLEKIKEEKAKFDQERKEKRERGEEVEESEEEVNSEEIKKKRAEKREEKRERRRRKKEDDDVSWDGSSSEESEDDSISDEDSQTTILKEKVDVIEEIKDIVELPTVPTTKSESYFDLFLGKFFMNIGLNLVQEYVQTDLLKQQKRKLQRERKGGHDTLDRELSIALLTKNLEMSQKTNATLTFEQKKCEFCTFKTESTLALAHHLETPHMKNNLYSCNNCPFVVKNPHDILFHMEKEHGVKAKLERAPASHQCANCPFEDHGKGKLGRHLIACAKKFKPELNLAPPIEWEHPAKIAKIPRARHTMAPYQMASQFGRHHVDGTGFAKVPIPISNAMPTMTTYRPRNRAVQPRPPLNIPVQMRPSGVLIRPAPPIISNYPPGNGRKSNNPSLSITPLPRQQNPVPSQPLQAANAKGFVICEICDGYIKDLEQLRNHMQWIHKVKIHPKMIYNRPPLNCQKCQFRFFTDQGLERHLLGSHGLVTSSMQEAANKGKDAGRCPVCGRVYQWKLLSHVSRDHNLILKPAHLSYKCTVCTATFGMYRQFENHVYSAHSVVAKKVIDKKTPAAAAKANANDNAAKQLKINDEITIIPQPVKIAATNKEK